jgi:ABC-type oligopeptide transport system ATPase subunit
MTSQANTNDRTETKTQSISRTELCRPVLTVKQLSKTFALHTVDETEVVGLDEVSFQVTAGEFLGVVGESGSGKSSLLKCIYRTYQATDGDILYHQRVQDQDNESGGKTPTEINLVSFQIEKSFACEKTQSDIHHNFLMRSHEFLQLMSSRDRCASRDLQIRRLVNVQNRYYRNFDFPSHYGRHTQRRSVEVSDNGSISHRQSHQSLIFSCLMNRQVHSIQKHVVLRLNC